MQPQPPVVWQRPVSLSHHSFHLILYLEWILLGITLLGAIKPMPMRMGSPALLPAMLTLVGFGLMGLKLPSGKLWRKLLYTALEFGLVFLTFHFGIRPVFFPLLGLIIVIRSCLIFQQLGRLMVAGLVFCTFLLMIFQQPPRPRLLRHVPPSEFANTILSLRLNTAVTFGLTLLFVLLLINALLTERQSREKLLHANDQLRQYALRIEDQATLQERNRIAREIHDALGHSLTAQSIQLENALLFLPPEAVKTRAFLTEAQQLGAKALQEVRRSVSTLRANPLQGQTLEGAIARAVTAFEQTTGIAPVCTVQLTQPLSAEIKTAVYRILQESLTNIAKHSHATKVEIYLQERQNKIQLEIIDNGQGFDPTRNTTGFGLQGMRERTAALGGKFLLQSQPGSGCRLNVLIPIPQLVL